MPEYFVIKGSKELNGTVELSGSKNSAACVLAAALLTEKECIIDNLPRIKDISSLLELLRSMGAEADWVGKHKARIKAGGSLSLDSFDTSLIGKTRMSVLLVGPLLTRFKKFKFFPPGGDRIVGNVRDKGCSRAGIRPITTHLEALAQMGLEIERERNTYCFKNKGLRPGKVALKEFSVTATENVMMAAAGTSGRTIILNAAAEPHVQDLGRMLGKMGAGVKGAGTHVVEIEGRSDLGGANHTIFPDYLEAGTFAVLGAGTAGVLKIKGFPSEHLTFFLTKLREMGIQFEEKDDCLKIGFCRKINPVRIQSLPHPGFPTDLLPVVVPLLTQADGRSLAHDPLYENRLGFMNELRKMGAEIEIVDPHRAFVFGKTPLFGVEISSWDIRAGASLVVAALMAQGETRINNINKIDRGYESFDEKLRQLGADIKRVSA